MIYKALLTLHGIEAPRTHDLRRLILLAEPFAPDIARFSDRVDALASHGVHSRYPDDSWDVAAAEMEKMVELANELGTLLLARLHE